MCIRDSAEAIIDQQVAEFVKWRGSLLAVPVIRGLRGRLQRLADEEMERFGGRLSQLSGEDREVVQQLVRSLVNKISHHPITHIKDYAAGDGVERLQTAVELFGIDHENRDDLAADCDVSVSYTHLRAHETVLDLVCRLLLEKKKKKEIDTITRQK